jgi:hypothetical protein
VREWKGWVFLTALLGVSIVLAIEGVNTLRTFRWCSEYKEPTAVVQSAPKLIASTKKPDAMPPPHFVPAPHPIDDTQLEVHTLEPIPPGNPFPAHPEPEAYEIKGGDYPAPQDTKK